MPSPFPNPPVDVNALMAPMTPTIVLTAITNSLVTLGIRADLWPKEGVAISCMAAVSSAISGFVNDRIAATKAGWLSTSTGNWLTWLALYMYGVLRVAATFASGQLTLTNAGGGVYNFQPFTASFKNPTTGQVYTNTSAIALAAGPSSQTINIQATTQGSVGNSAPGTITAILTTMLGVTCSNTVSVIGIDAQSDAFLQSKCWNSIAANSAYGPRQSLGYAVQNALNGVTFAPVNINRFAISESSHTGNVFVTVASPSGVTDPNDVAGVATSLESIARPPGVTLTAQAAITLAYAQGITCYVTNTPGLSAAAVTTAIQNALNAFFSNYPINGKVGPAGARALFGSAVEGACVAAWPPQPTDGSVWVSGVFEVVTTGTLLPLPDLPLLVGQVATNATTVTVVLV